MKRFTSVLTTILMVLALAGLTAAADVKAFVDQGVAHLDDGKFDQAINNFNEALKLQPNDAALYDYRGIAYRAKGQDDLALKDFNKAMELDPKFARAYRDRAMIYFDRSEFDKSIEDQIKAQSLGYKIDPDFLKLTRRKAAEKK